MKDERTIFETIANGKRTYHYTKKSAGEAARPDPSGIVYRCTLPNMGAATLLAVLNGDIRPTRKTVVTGELPLMTLLAEGAPIAADLFRVGHVRLAPSDSPKYGRLVLELDVSHELTEARVDEFVKLFGEPVAIHRQTAVEALDGPPVE